jgi:uncharacterized protein (TIRG00374 family)
VIRKRLEKSAVFFLAYNFSVKKLIIAIVLLLAVLFLFSRFTEIQDVAAVLARGNFWFIGLALLLQAAWLVNLGHTYHSVFKVVDIPVTPWHMTRVATATMFIGVVAPSGGLSGAAYLLVDANNNRRSTGRTAVGGVLIVWLEYCATLFVLAFGLAEMARRNNLHWTEVTASLVLLAGALVITVLLYLGMKSSVLLARVLAWCARAINSITRPFIHRDYLSEERAYSFAFEAAEGILTLRKHPRLVVRPLFHGLVNKILLILILMTMFRAFDVSFTPQAVVAGFSIAYLFLIVSPTPAGLGIVEGVMTVALVSMQVPFEASAIITLAYRGVTFWVPVLVGMLAFRSLHSPSGLR